MASDAPANGLYAQLEEKYYSLMDWLEKKGVPVYKAIDAIEARNIPSFPIFILLCALILGLAVWGISAAFFSSASLQVTVQDSLKQPISGATIDVLVDGKSLGAQATNAAGNAVFNVPLNKAFQIKAEKGGYVDKAQNYPATQAQSSAEITMQQEITTLKKTVNLLQAGTSRLFGKQIDVDFSCSGNTSFAQRKSTSTGTIDIDVPGDCDTLIARPSGNFSISNDSAFLSSGGVVSYSVEETQAGKGSAIVTVANSQGTVVPGIDVSLYTVSESNAAGTIFQTKQTSATGSASFTDVPSGRYYIVAFDRGNNYAEYDGSSEQMVQEIKANSLTTFSVVLSQGVVGKIRLLVKDKANGNAVQGATVKLSKGQTEITTSQTGADGKVEFSVGEEVEYRIYVDKAAYLIKTASLRPSVDFQQIEIEQATAENSQSLLVSIVDENNKPVENVRLKLKKNADGTQVGGELVTGLDGRGIFQRVDDGVYYVYAVKPGVGEKYCDPVTLSSRQANAITCQLNIGTGRLETGILDEDGKPIVNATIKVVDSFSSSVIAEETTDSDGKKIIAARADKEVFLVVAADGYASTTTVPVQMQKDVTLGQKIVLRKAIQSFEIELEGVYSNGEKISSGSGLNAGEKYTAKFLLLVPKSSVFDEAGVHVRTGNDDASTMEQDNLYISDVRAAFSGIAEGTTYTPPAGQGNDAQHYTTGNAKWANIVFRNVSGGVYEAEADLQVRAETRIGSQLELWYRAWGKSGGYLRVPTDAALGTAESIPEKQGLYANARKRPFSVGPSTLCGEDFCSSYSIEDTKEKITSGISDSYSAQVEGTYRLLFEISGTSETPFSAAQLLIKDRSSSIAIQSYSITPALGQQRQGQGIGSELSMQVGDIARDSVVKGEIIFQPRKEGTAQLDVSILSGTGTASEVYKKSLLIKVQPAQQLSLDVLPKSIVPLINNNVLARVSGDNDAAVANATVSIKSNGTVIASGETDIEGVFAYTLLSPGDGSTIGILAEKPGFKSIEKELGVSGNILSSDPKTVKLSMAVGGTAFKNIDALLLNYSQVPLQVEEVSASRDFQGFAQFAFDAPTTGEIIGSDSNAELAGTLRLGPQGATIAAPIKILGSLNVVVSSAAFQQKWVSSIPFELTIGFGDNVDDTDCFGVFPGEWQIFGAPSQAKQLNVTMTNSCKVSGGAIPLRNLSIRVVTGNDNALGKFRASSTLDGSTSAELTNTFRNIAAIVPVNAEQTLTLDFQPAQIVSGKSDMQIEVRATNLTANGPEDLTKAIKVSINMNNLNECLEVLASRDLTVNSCPNNMGFNNYGGQFSQYQNSRYTQFDPYSNRNGYGTGLPPYIGSDLSNGSSLAPSYQNYANYANNYYPNQNYSQPFYGNDYSNNAYSGSWNCGSTSFQISNSCESAVDVSFDAQPGIIVRDKTITIQPNEQSDVTVEPTNFFGRYELNLKAKPSTSNEKATDIAKIYVNVVNEATKNYRDCISLSPSQTLNFNNFFGKPVELKVMNSCYNEGVYLDSSTNAVSFAGLGINTPTDESAGVKELIESWGLIDEKFETQPNGKVTQVLTFEVAKALSTYRNKAPPAQFFEANKYADIGNLRYFLSTTYYSVMSRTNLVVRFTTPYGGQRTTSFRLVLQDLWPLLEAGARVSEQFTTYGDPKFTPEQCLKKESLNFIKITGGELPVGRIYSTLENGGLFRYATKNPTTNNESGGCGTVDFISDLEPTSFKDPKTGLVMNVQLDNGGHEMSIGFDETSGPWNGQKTNFNVKIIGNVNRISPPGKQLVGFNIQISVAGRQGAGTGPGTGPGQGGETFSFACENGNSGTDVYRKYGLQHISYEWRVSGDSPAQKIPENACNVYEAANPAAQRKLNADSAPLFCDAVQATVEFSRKIDRAKAITTIVKGANSGNGLCVTTANEFNCAEPANRNSLELFRFVLDQNKGYFTSASDKAHVLDLTLKAIAMAPLNDSKILADSISQMNASQVDAQQNTAIANNTENLIGKIAFALENPELKGLTYVLELNSWSDADNKVLPTEKISDNLYAVQLSAYREFNSKVLSNPNCQNKVTTCTIDGKTVTTDLLKKIAAGTWKITAKNSGMSNSVKELVMESGSWNSSYKAINSGSFLQFYRQNIKPSMFLMKDNYNESFASAMKTSSDYGSMMPSTLSFTEGSVEAGDYNVTISYKWADSGSAEITFTKNRDLKQIDSDNKKGAEKFDSHYADNVLFSLPIDGTVDAGTSFTNANGKELVFNNYGNQELSDVSPLPVAKTKGNPGGSVSFSVKRKQSDVLSGKIASISRTAFEYSPSDPIKLEVKFSKNSKADEAAGFLYEFVSSNNSRINELSGIQWNAEFDEVGNNTGKMTAQEFNGGDLCRNLSTMYPGFIINEPKTSASATYSALVFVPALYSGNTTSINLPCQPKDSGSLTETYDLVPPNSVRTQDLQQGKLALNTNLSGRYQTTYNLQNLLNLVKGSSDSEAKVCFKAANNTVDLFWNAKAFEAS
ncbi:MAG: carboxypeptidase-like regulatory domain-containing protein [archaeon]